MTNNTRKLHSLNEWRDGLRALPLGAQLGLATLSGALGVIVMAASAYILTPLPQSPLAMKRDASVSSSRAFKSKAQITVVPENTVAGLPVLEPRYAVPIVAPRASQRGTQEANLAIPVQDGAQTEEARETLKQRLLEEQLLAEQIRLEDKKRVIERELENKQIEQKRREEDRAIEDARRSDVEKRLETRRQEDERKLQEARLKNEEETRRREEAQKLASAP